MSFDPSLFLDSQVTESNSTSTIPVPVGEYLAVVEKVDARQWTKKDDPTVSGIALDITYSISDANVLALLGRDKATVKQGIMLDMTDAGGIDFGKGKNVGLGRLREAVDLNVPGQPFAFSMLVGRMAKVNVAHRLYNDAIFADVKGVAKAS